jgi:hypothetical protein
MNPHLFSDYPQINILVRHIISDKENEVSENKRYIKGKDGKLQGSLPASPNLPTPAADSVIPPKPYAEVEVSIEKVYEKEAEINQTLSEGLAEISKAFENIEAIYKERAERNKQAVEESNKRVEAASAAAKIAKEKYERILEEQEARKLSNRIKKLFNRSDK